MKLKQINEGLKCPNCKKFGLKPFHIRFSGAVGTEVEGRAVEWEFGSGTFYRCRNCYAEFQEEK